MRKIKSEELQQAVDLVQSHGGIDQAAESIGIPRSTLAHRYHVALDKGYVPTGDGTTSHAAATSKIRDQKKRLATRLEQTETTIEQLRKQLNIALDISEHKPSTKIEPIIKRKCHESTAVIVASDWHIEERVYPGTVNGINEYSINIARKRIQNLFRNGLKLVEMVRSKSEINTLILALLGDLITGYIHEELLEENELSPTQACVEVLDLLTAGIDFLLKNAKLQQIIIPCCCGNHGRTTIKPRVSTYSQNSFEWLVYKFLEKQYKDRNEHRVTVIPPDGYFTHILVYDKLIRFHHGDGIKYQGGVGGVEIPLNKAIAQWNTARTAYLDVMGHWHSRKCSRNFAINGSVIGYNPYSIKIKAGFEPPCQSFFLIHPEWGKTVEAPILLDS